jgi:Alcohol dehydrogenase GroES-like domain
MPTVYPCVPGHEIVGRVTKVGSAVTKFKPGDLAAVGCLVDSEGNCPDPTPNIEKPLTPVYENDEKYFYPVIRVSSVERWKPYFTKTRCQCYVRVGNTTKLAGRTDFLLLTYQM